MQVTPGFAPGPSAEVPLEGEANYQANVLPFHTPIKPGLNPSASRPRGPGVAVLFSLVFSIGSEGEV